MSLWTVVVQDATDIEQGVVSGLKTGLQYVDNVVVTDFIPELETALMTKLETFTQAELALAIAALEKAV